MGAGGHVARKVSGKTLNRGEIRLYAFPKPDKPRPVLILTRQSALGYLGTATIAPITSTIRGVPSEVALSEQDGMKKPCAVNLHNVITVSQERIGRRVASISPGRLAEVCAAVRFALGCD
jgi:mRNA interferase MazF